MKIAIIQPYFLPYGGYFRLYEETDMLIYLDNVQFTRTGWVHRNRFLRQDGPVDWATLPLAQSSRDTQIRHKQFSLTFDEDFKKLHRRFPALADGASGLIFPTLDQAPTPVAFITNLLKQVCQHLGVHHNVRYASEIDVPENLHGQDRIIALAQAVDAITYINPPGGRDLYDAKAFAKAGLELRFLEPYEGSMLSICQTLYDRKTR